MANPNGAKPYEPSAYHAQKVRDLASLKTPLDDIAAAIHISTPTLKKYYGDQIKHAHILVEAEISRVLLKSCRRGDIKAIQHWDATRGNYQPKSQVDLISSDGSMKSTAPPEQVFFVAVEPGQPIPTFGDDQDETEENDGDS